MTMIQKNIEPVSTSCEDTIFVISGNDQLVENIRNFCVSRNMKLWIGDPNFPGVIDARYKVGIVDKYWMDPNSWADWIEFLRETKGESHDHLLVIILPPRSSQAAFDEAKSEFQDAHGQVRFMFDLEGRSVVKIIEDWLDAGSIIVPTNSKETRQVTFRDRLDELMNRFTFEDTRDKVNLDAYFKFRIQAKWLLAQHLGENHPYTKELNTLFVADMDPFSVGTYLLAAKGILEGLAEDLDRGFIELEDGT